MDTKKLFEFGTRAITDYYIKFVCREIPLDVYQRSNIILNYIISLIVLADSTKYGKRELKAEIFKRIIIATKVVNSCVYFGKLFIIQVDYG